MTYKIGSYVCDNCGKEEPGDPDWFPNDRAQGQSFRTLEDGRHACSRACAKALDPTGWDPEDVEGLRAWWRADEDGVVRDQFTGEPIVPKGKP